MRLLTLETGVIGQKAAGLSDFRGPDPVNGRRACQRVADAVKVTQGWANLTGLVNSRLSIAQMLVEQRQETLEPWVELRSCPG